MGSGSVFRCKSCGKEKMVFLGTGFTYPLICIKAKNDALNGKYGKGMRRAVQEHPKGAMDCEELVYVCDCGAWKVEPMLAYYEIKDKNCGFDGYYFRFEDEETPPALLYARRHLCPKCRRKMRVAAEEEIKRLRCPECGGELETDEKQILWD